MDSQFVLGCIASEGCFSTNFSKGTYRFGVSMAITFHFGAHERDIEHVRSLQNEVGAGGIKHYEGQARWHVQRNEDIDTLIEYIETHRGEAFEQTAKFESYRKWRELHRDRYDLLETLDGALEFIERGVAINPTDGRRGRSEQEVKEIVREYVRDNNPQRDKKLLESTYDKYGTIQATAEELDITPSTISKWLDKHNIDKTT